MKTILLVDDEEKIRRLYKRLLEDEGYKVLTAPDIVEARKFLKSVCVDLVVLDINMGELRGDILYELITCFHKGIRVLVASVYPVEDQKRVMPEADDYFDKSAGNQVLLDKVGVLLGKEVDP